MGGKRTFGDGLSPTEEPSENGVNANHRSQNDHGYGGVGRDREMVYVLADEGAARLSGHYQSKT
jgi:hypothetical protein